MATTTVEVENNNAPAALQLSDGKMKILKAVTTLLEDPSNKITVNRIANHIAVTEAALYRHYRSKEDIFMALLEYTESHFMVPLSRAQQHKNMMLSKNLFHIFKDYMGFLELHPGLARLLLGQANTEAAGISDKVALLHGKIRSQLALLVKRDRAENKTESPLSSDQTADILYSMIVSAALASTLRIPQLPWESRWQSFEIAVFNDQQSSVSLHS